MQRVEIYIFFVLCLQITFVECKIKIVKFNRVLNFYDPDIYSFYMTVRQIGGISSTAQCGSYVLKTYELTVPGSRANAFSYQGTSCEIGRVSPLYGFLDENMSKSVDSKLGFVLAGCSGNYKNLPRDLYGYWHLSDDYMFFGNYGNFSAITVPDALQLSKYSFTVLSPVPSFTGKWAPQFNGNNDGSIVYAAPPMNVQSFTFLVWYYVFAVYSWSETVIELSKGDANGNLVSETGTILQMNSKSAWMTEHFFAVGGPVHGQHYNSQSFLKYRKWQYLGIVYDFKQGTVKFYKDGNQTGVTQNVGKFVFASGLSLVRIGHLNNQAIASVEIYLRSLTDLEIAEAMARSKTYPINPTCPF